VASVGAVPAFARRGGAVNKTSVVAPRMLTASRTAAYWPRHATIRPKSWKPRPTPSGSLQILPGHKPGIRGSGFREAIGRHSAPPESASDLDADERAQHWRRRAMEESKEVQHWNKTTKLMFTHLGVWLFFGYIIHMFVVPLNKIIIPILGFPLGFYMAAQGSLIVFVVMLFMFAKQQDKIDREFGFAEED
jgi:putative solute:sodium symporter small subunit